MPRSSQPDHSTGFDPAILSRLRDPVGAIHSMVHDRTDAEIMNERNGRAREKILPQMRVIQPRRFQG